MTAAALLADLQRRGVTITADGDQLRCNGPDEVLTPETLDELRTHKAAILAAHAVRLSAPAADRLAGDSVNLAALPAGALPLWLIDQLYPELAGNAPEPAPPGLTPEQIATLVEDARLTAEQIIDAVRRPLTAPINNPRPHWHCRKCKGRDWWQQDRLGGVLWRCGNCTPRPVDADADDLEVPL